MRAGLVLCVVASLFAVQASAQTTEPPPGEKPVVGALRTEARRIGEDCSAGLKGIPGCLVTLVTDHPIHVAFGSIAPQNGFGFGAAVGWNHNAERFPWDLSADAVRAPAGAWRAGLYFKLHKPDQSIPHPVPAGQGSDPASFIKTIPIYEAYVQSVSLPVMPFYGLGNDTTRAEKAFFSMTETMVGGTATVPVGLGQQTRLRLALLGEVNGRFVETGSSPSSPSLDSSTVSIPSGFDETHDFAQFGEGARAKFVVGSRLHFGYEARFQQFVTASGADLNFKRVIVDLDHQFSIYRRFRTNPTAQQQTPNGCAQKPDGRCQPGIEPLRVDRSWNRTGTVGARVLLVRSLISGANTVPLAFQQTLGGSDINGLRQLASYDDYRFSGPQLLVFMESFEHSIAGPFGAWVELCQGRVALDGEALTSHLRHSVAVGATLRAGAAPMVTISYSTGGPEGNHFAVVMTSHLLGGSSRPSWR